MQIEEFPTLTPVDSLGVLMRPTPRVASAEIVSYWNKIALERDGEIRSGNDLSMVHVLVPAVLGLCRLAPRATDVLDVGCGSGYLTERLAKRYERLTGIDPSVESIKIAKAHSPSLRYESVDLEDFKGTADSFDLIVANMVLMDVTNLDQVVAGIARLLRSGGIFVFTITHPSFWPMYWGYMNEDWFKYDREIAIEATFRTSSSVSSQTTIHFHRPLETYSDAICENGLILRKFKELRPSRRVELKYPAPWKFPRFLACAVQKP